MLRQLLPFQYSHCSVGAGDGDVAPLGELTWLLQRLRVIDSPGRLPREKIALFPRYQASPTFGDSPNG